MSIHQPIPPDAPHGKGAVNPPRDPDWTLRLSGILLFSGLAAVVAGLLYHQTFEHLPWRHTEALLAVAGVALALTMLLHGLVGWRLGLAGAAVGVAALAWFTGAAPLMALGLLALAALGVGDRLVPQGLPGRPALSLVAGLGLLAGLAGWTLSLEIHNALVYAAVLLGLVVLNRHRTPGALGLNRVARPAGLSGSGPAGLSGAWALFGVLLLILGTATLWLPDLMYDDLAYHLGLAYQLEAHGYYRMDPASQVWALAPWAGDLIVAVVHVLGGEGARSAVNALWLVLAAALVRELALVLGLDSGRAWLTVALFISLPIVGTLAAGLQTEGPGITVMLALALVILRAPDRPDPQILCLVAVLAGFSLALKLTNALSLLPLGTWLLVRWRGRLPWAALLPALLLGLAVAGSSYFHAWALTGNPVLPLYNDLFESGYFRAERFQDQRWTAGLDWALPWTLTFQAERFFEGASGVTGFVLVGLLGALPLALARSRTRPLLLVGLAAFLLPLLFVQHLRYAMPGLVLMLPALVAALGDVRPRRLAEGALAGLAVLNLSFHGNGHWTLWNGGLADRLVHGHAVVERNFTPEVAVARWVRNMQLDDARIFMVSPDRPYAAPFAGQAFVRVWYDPSLHQAGEVADLDSSGRSWRALWRETGMTHVLTAGSTEPAVLAALAGAELEHRYGDAQLWRLPEGSERNLMAERDLARQRLIRKRLLP